MIRINLLPFRAARAKENIRRQVSIFSLMALLLLFVFWYVILHYDDKIKEHESKIASVKQEISIYKAKADRVTKIEKELALLQQKLDAIDSLNNIRKEPVVLMDNLTQLVIPERMWITYLKSAGNSVTLKGVAFDQQTVADFMTNVKSSELFNSEGVDLKTIQLKSIKDAKVREFELVCAKSNVAPKK
ncbi:PilN [Desulfamplus magnetovallimortis]|uniref:PilN n=1 Tax=Desulfamplus magnetovallimortis TaxID=1246637 RepID=A0A1W1HIF0_9BACT|nr:PilN domain-containing protein [Desulfamplus magnetovallimortis]SLM32195.1 PilN [Desulfamplus magnetovallimortis]